MTGFCFYLTCCNEKLAFFELCFNGELDFQPFTKHVFLGARHYWEEDNSRTPKMAGNWVNFNGSSVLYNF